MYGKKFCFSIVAKGSFPVFEFPLSHCRKMGYLTKAEHIHVSHQEISNSSTVASKIKYKKILFPFCEKILCSSILKTFAWNIDPIKPQPFWLSVQSSQCILTARLFLSVLWMDGKGKQCHKGTSPLTATQYYGKDRWIGNRYFHACSKLKFQNVTNTLSPVLVKQLCITWYQKNSFLFAKDCNAFFTEQLPKTRHGYRRTTSCIAQIQQQNWGVVRKEYHPHSFTL